tara:strand:- start:129 stop:380 length:252 start_codon:yes stop_codon:yes gene_type:complete
MALASKYPDIAANIVIDICPKRRPKFVPISIKIVDGGGKRYSGISSKKTRSSQTAKITIENKIGIPMVPDLFILLKNCNTNYI